MSFYAPGQLDIVLDVCQSFACDNGAFSAWKSGRPILDWHGYYEWIDGLRYHPAFDWAVIPDVIDGTVEDNDRLVDEWPFPGIGVPVWHMSEPPTRLKSLCERFPRVALGSTGEFATVGDARWWNRMITAMEMACDFDGRPITKLHGLRMLNPEVFTRLPLASADSTNAAINCGLDAAWQGRNEPPTKGWRAMVLMARIESHNSAARWMRHPRQEDLFTQEAA